MANIPDVEPMPNPWLDDGKSSKKSAPSAIVYVDEDSISDRDTQAMMMKSGGSVRVMQYVGADGSLSMLTPQEMQRPANLCLAGCCPCFISCQPCAPKRRGEYKNLVQMASFWLCVVDLLLLIASIALDGFAPPSSNYSLGPTTDALLWLGAQYGKQIRYDYEVWRFVTTMFLHGGIIHYLFNAAATIRFCVMLERKWGTIVFCALYASAGIAASIFSAFLLPKSVSVGASGAICGIFGAYCAEIVFTWRETQELVRRNALIQAAIIVAMLLVMSFFPHVDAYAHLGGLAFGFLAGIFVFGRKSKTIKNACVAQVVPWVALALSIAYFAISLSIFFTVFKP